MSKNRAAQLDLLIPLAKVENQHSTKAVLQKILEREFEPSMFDLHPHLTRNKCLNQGLVFDRQFAEVSLVKDRVHDSIEQTTNRKIDQLES